MTKKIIFGAMLCIAAVSAFVACDKKDKEELEEITLFGTVIDGSTGDPLQNVQIEVYRAYMSAEQQIEDMNNGGSMGAVGSTVTGSDGSYEFAVSNINRKYSYAIIANKKQYNEGEMILSLNNVKSGGKLRCDFQLTPQK
ncbi:MAG: hypothetical protein IKP02_01910 [Paludibacteraceae bacterium]|nr:hypothetical protein [Paludibacteraceae bacterium]